MALCAVYISHPSVEGMYGSGVLVINPPWTLYKQLEEALPVLVKLLGDVGAGYHLNQSADKDANPSVRHPAVKPRDPKN